MIIDCHTHVFPDEVRRNRVLFCKKDKGFSSIYGDPKAKMIGVDDLMASMDEAEIDASVLCGFSWERSDLCHPHNQYLLESATRHPHRFVVFLSLPFSDPDQALRELDNGIREGARGVGEVAFYQREMTSQDLDLMRPVLKWMEERRIPLLLHANETIGHSYPGKGETPLGRFYELVHSHPDLPIVLAHWGGGLLFYELMPEVARVFANVYYDTAASPYLYSPRIYRLGCEVAGADKILFGSDFPLISPTRYFREMEESGLNRGDQEKILSLNLSRLLRWDRKGPHAA